MGKLPRIVIVGRPNVGKSTLFNRLVGRRCSLVHDMPGVTRDRIEQEIEWKLGGRALRAVLVDTGGLGGDRFADEIRRQVEIALASADVVIAVFDSQTGITGLDRDLLRELQKKGVADRLPVLCMVNKVDAEVHEERSAEFYEFGLEHLLTVSAEHGRGIDELQEWVMDQLADHVVADRVVEDRKRARGEEADESDAEGRRGRDRTPRVAIIGKPNVGKSTLVNALLGEERMITSPIAGTTVDAVDSIADLNGHPIMLIDTAGIRRKDKTEQGVEVLSVVQAKKALERADIAILLMDGELGTADQDEKIGSLIEEAGCSVILAVNKWDTQKRNPDFSKEDAAERIRGKMGYLKYAPIIFISARERTGFSDLGELITEILHQRQLRIPTKEFTEWVRRESTVHNPASAKFFMCHQAGRNPPTFVCHVSDPKKIHFTLKRYLINCLRERWGFMGTPVRMHFVETKSSR